MKINFLTLLIALTIISCNNNTEKAEATDVAAQAAPQEEPVFDERKSQTYEGRIGNDKEIIMTFNTSEPLVKGSLIYKDQEEREVISLEGGFSDGQLFLKERTDNGGKAVFKGSVENGVYKGFWVASGSQDEIPFIVERTNQNFEEYMQ